VLRNFWTPPKRSQILIDPSKVQYKILVKNISILRQHFIETFYRTDCSRILKDNHLVIFLLTLIYWFYLVSNFLSNYKIYGFHTAIYRSEIRARNRGVEFLWWSNLLRSIIMGYLCGFALQRRGLSNLEKNMNFAHISSEKWSATCLSIRHRHTRWIKQFWTWPVSYWFIYWVFGFELWRKGIRTTFSLGDLKWYIQFVLKKTRHYYIFNYFTNGRRYLPNFLDPLHSPGLIKGLPWEKIKFQEYF
jgi:hypothetical protein